jgi:hypothetical protein
MKRDKQSKATRNYVAKHMNTTNRGGVHEKPYKAKRKQIKQKGFIE